MERKSSWASYTIMEVPFWRNGMTPEEYEEERKHYYTMLGQGKGEEYKPLWQQNEK